MSMLRSIREKKGLTVSQLAARASISSRVIGDYEEGRQSIPLPHAKLLAKALWVPIEDLMPPAGSASFYVAAITPSEHPTNSQTQTHTQQPQVIQQHQAPTETSREVLSATLTSNGEVGGGGPIVSGDPTATLVQPQPSKTKPANNMGEGQKTMRSARSPRAATPVTEGQLQELMHLAGRLQISQDKLEERVGKAISTLTRPDAKEWIKRLRAIAEEIAPNQKIRYGQWPEAHEDREAAYLREHRDAGAMFTFKLFNNDQITGTITDFTPYTITIKANDEEDVVLRKLAIAYYRRLADSGSSDTEQQANNTIDDAIEQDQTAHNHARDDHHQPMEDRINSNHIGTPDIPEEDNMDEDRGA